MKKGMEATVESWPAPAQERKDGPALEILLDFSPCPFLIGGKERRRLCFGAVFGLQAMARLVKGLARLVCFYYFGASYLLLPFRPPLSHAANLRRRFPFPSRTTDYYNIIRPLFIQARSAGTSDSNPAYWGPVPSAYRPNIHFLPAGGFLLLLLLPLLHPHPHNRRFAPFLLGCQIRRPFGLWGMRRWDGQTPLQANTNANAQ